MKNILDLYTNDRKCARIQIGIQSELTVHLIKICIAVKINLNYLF